MNYRTDLIRPPQRGDDEVKYKDGNTQDIISVVLYGDSKAAFYTKEFAPSLKGTSVLNTCQNIWRFVKTQIPYVLDPEGKQFIKSPGRLWFDKAGDCKSFSVFTASCLKNLNIPYGYRFTSYKKSNPTPTHVYVYVPLANGKEIILDSVWDGPFNTQKKFEHKQDKPMSEISYLGGVGSGVAKATNLSFLHPTANGQRPTANHHSLPANTKGTPYPQADYTEFKLPKNFDEMSDAEMELLLTRQRLAIEKHNSAMVGGPFNFQQDNYDAAIAVVNRCLANVHDGDAVCAIGAHIEAIGKKKGGKTAAGRFLQKVGKGIKAGAKAVVKVATAPVRLIAKGAMEIYLPKAAPFFLYLFAATPDALPDVMKRKRAKADKFKKFVVNGLGMKDNHFMAIIRNALTKRLGKSPESYMADKLRSRVSGIGKTKAKRKAAAKAKPNRFNKAIQPIKAIRKADALAPTELQPNSFAMQVDQQQFNADLKSNPVPVQGKGQAFKDVITKAGSGNLVGAAIDAIMWLINKIGGKDKPERITADDFPDFEGDAANVFDYRDMQEDYTKLSEQQREQTKQVATDLMLNNAPDSTIERVLSTAAAFLTPHQRKEIKYEIQEGPEALSDDEGRYLATEIKDYGRNMDNALSNGGGGAGTGLCSC